MVIDIEYREFHPKHYPIEARQIADIAFLKIKRRSDGMPPNPSCSESRAMCEHSWP
jgi:hypothetical protein